MPPVIIQEKNVTRKIKKLWEKATDIAQGKCKKADKDNFLLGLDKLLDLTTCPHKIVTCDSPQSGCTSEPCPLGAHIDCTCPLSQKIPKLELLWLHAQRSKVVELSSMYMGSNDVKESNRQLKSERRKAADIEAKQKQITKDDYCKERQVIDEDDNLYCDLEDENEVESSNSISNKNNVDEIYCELKPVKFKFFN